MKKASLLILLLSFFCSMLANTLSDIIRLKRDRGLEQRVSCIM